MPWTMAEHADHVLWLGVTKSFGPLDSSVPYIVIGGAGVYRHTLYEGDDHDSLVDAVGLTPGIGVGWRQWNKSRTRFIAPEARLFINAYFTVSVVFGFQL